MPTKSKELPRVREDLKLEDAQRLLAAHGLKATPQRVAILEALRSGKHLTAEEAQAEASKITHVGTTTVYFTLRVLADAGLVEILADSKGRVRYGFAGAPHVNLECLVCGRIEDYPAPPEGLSGHGSPGWKVHTATVVLRGYCPVCAKAIKPVGAM